MHRQHDVVVHGRLLQPGFHLLTDGIQTVERDFLIQELARAVGLGGRDRRVGATAERARVSVTRAVRYALARIHEHHPALGAHLDHAVRTGTYLSYQPDPQAHATWEL